MDYYYKHVWRKPRNVFPPFFLLFLAVVLVGCGIRNSGVIVTPDSKSTPAPSQVLTFPDVGVTDITSLDPALEFDMPTSIIMNMLYSRLVRLDSNAHARPDQP